MYEFRRNDYDVTNSVQVSSTVAVKAAVRELLIDKGVFTAEDVRRQVENMDGRNAGRGWYRYDKDGKRL